MRWLERYLQEYEPTLAQAGLAVSALSALADDHATKLFGCCGELIGSF